MTEPNANLPREKQTTLGLYVSSWEAYQRWLAEPDKVKIIDVRTPEEYLFVGHPVMAWKIPVAIQSYEWDPEKKKFPMKPLPDFVSRVREVANSDDTLTAHAAAQAAAAPSPSICWRKQGSSMSTTSWTA